MIKSLFDAISTGNQQAFETTLEHLQSNLQRSSSLLYQVITCLVTHNRLEWIMVLEERFTNTFYQALETRLYGLGLLSFAVKTGAIEFLNSLKDAIDSDGDGFYESLFLESLATECGNGHYTLSHALCEHNGLFNSSLDTFCWLYDEASLRGLPQRFDAIGFLPWHYLFKANESRPNPQFVAVLQERCEGSSRLQTQSGDNVLHLFLKQQRHLASLDTLQYLVEVIGCDVMQRDARGFSALAVAAQFSSVDVMEYLLGRIKINDSDLALMYLWHESAKTGHIDMLRYFEMIELPGSDVEDTLGYFPIHYAAQHGYLESACLLLSDDSVLNNSRTNDTPLHLAAKFGHQEVVNFLVGALSLEEQLQLNYDGFSALHLAVRYKRIECAAAMISLDVPLQAWLTASGENCLHLFAKYRFGDKGLWDLLCSQGDDCISEMLVQQNIQGMTPLHVAAFHDGGRGALSLLLSKSCEVHLNVSDTRGNTPLHCAYMVGARHTAYQLIQHGANPQYLNNDAKFPNELSADPQLMQLVLLEYHFNYRASSDYQPPMDDIGLARPANVAYSLEGNYFNTPKPRHKKTMPEGKKSAVFTPIQKQSLQAFYTKMFNQSIDQQTEHFLRLIELSFYTFVAYWDLGECFIERESPEYFQHGTAAPEYHACHDASISQRFRENKPCRVPELLAVEPLALQAVDPSIQSYFSRQYIRKGILDGTHLLDNLNATTGLPASANRFDTILEMGHRGSNTPGVRGVFDNLLNQVADPANTMTPIEAIATLLIQLRLQASQLRLNYASDDVDLTTETSTTRQATISLLLLMINSKLEGDVVCIEYIGLLLRMTVEEIDLLKHLPSNASDNVLGHKMNEIKAEILTSESTFFKPFSRECKTIHPPLLNSIATL